MSEQVPLRVAAERCIDAFEAAIEAADARATAAEQERDRQEGWAIHYRAVADDRLAAMLAAEQELAAERVLVSSWQHAAEAAEARVTALAQREGEQVKEAAVQGYRSGYAHFGAHRYDEAGAVEAICKALASPSTPSPGEPT